MSNYFDYNDLVQESVSRLRHNEGRKVNSFKQ